jgi:hypothetical protein
MGLGKGVGPGGEGFGKLGGAADVGVAGHDREGRRVIWTGLVEGFGGEGAAEVELVLSDGAVSEEGLEVAGTYPELGEPNERRAIARSVMAYS